MPSIKDAIYYLFHIQELSSIVQWKFLRSPIEKRNESTESHDLSECYRFLYLTSRSFASVIQELPRELLVPIIVFYLVLRGLDTIEDDMTIDIEQKEPMLRNFHTYVGDENWNFNGSGPNEKDREVLVKFDCVSREFNKLKHEYKVIIKDITKQMGDGMADTVRRAETEPNNIKTIKDYELYCHYVAGLLGEGLTRLFIEAGLAEPVLLEKPELMESMGQFLQQTNIIRDVREDHDDKRYFWPKEVWSKYVDTFDELFLPHNQGKAVQCSSEMVLIALNKAEECLEYMAGITEQGVFNFVAIPQTMAIATLELCFQNPLMFERNIKISKGAACQIMLESTQSLQGACQVFSRFAKRIKEDTRPSNPHYPGIRAACGKVERFVKDYSQNETPRILQHSAVKDTMLDSKGKRQRVKANNDMITAALAIFATLAVFAILRVIAGIMPGNNNLTPTRSNVVSRQPTVYEGRSDL